MPLAMVVDWMLHLVDELAKQDIKVVTPIVLRH